MGAHGPHLVCKIPAHVSPSYPSVSGLSARISSMTPSPPRALSIDWAAFLPEAMASMSAPGPLPTSPPALNAGHLGFQGLFIRNDKAALDLQGISRPPTKERSAACPMARMTWSTSNDSLTSSKAGAENCLRYQKPMRTLPVPLPDTTPFSPKILLGPHEGINLTPSSRAISSSHSLAGISSRLSRQAMVTAPAPHAHGGQGHVHGHIAAAHHQYPGLSWGSPCRRLRRKGNQPPTTHPATPCLPLQFFDSAGDPRPQKRHQTLFPSNPSKLKSLPSICSVSRCIPVLNTWLISLSTTSSGSL